MPRINILLYLGQNVYILTSCTVCTSIQSFIQTGLVQNIHEDLELLVAQSLP